MAKVLLNLVWTMEITIKPIQPQDVTELLEMIKDLARFEHLEREVEATVERLNQSFFGPQPAAGALFARFDGEAAGYAIYFFTFSSFIARQGIWLEDIYVRPKFRKRGLGRQLIEAVAQVGVDRNCGRYEWMALNWNERALDFYQSIGARAMKEWVMHRMNPVELRRLGGR
jgi:GNAT superfamily N-acetyltransferase